MKLVRFGPRGGERPGVLDADAARIVDVSRHVRDFDPRFLGEGGVAYLRGLLASRRGALLPRLPLAGLRLGPPVAGPRQLLAVGVNYHEHSRETGVAAPAEPVLFAKSVAAISGPFDPIVIPRGRTTVDFEVELAFVLGATVLYPSADEARAAIAGYLVMNDVSERTVQKQGGLKQWFRGKSFDTFAPLGPWLVTADEVEDPHALDLSLSIDGETLQASNTRHMIHSCESLLMTAADGMTLEPGDLVSTGTPSGVGFTREPPRYLRPGELVEAEVAGLGRQATPVVAG